MNRLQNMPADHPGFIYFIESGGFIKIGWTRNVDKRLGTFRTSNPNPVDVLLVITGSREQEGDLHARFQKYRIQGEWYKADRSILEMLDELELPKGTSAP